MEVHVPQTFTVDRPAVHYTHECLSMPIGDHPLAKKLPRATTTTDPSIHPGPQDFSAFAAREGAPSTLEDFIHSDLPQLSLHITSFADATLVALSWPHSLMDVMGQKALLHAWSLVLAERVSDVPALLGAREDAVCAAAETSSEPREEFGLGTKQLTGKSMLWFGARFAWDLCWNPPAETRTMFLPKEFVVGLRQQALTGVNGENGEGADAFVSEGDTLTAWVVRAIACSSPQPRPVTALHALNMRFRLKSLVEASGVYVQNMAVAGFAFLPSDIASGGLGPIALANRRCLEEQATESQVLAFVRELCLPDGGDPSIVCGDPNAILVPFTNWTKAEFTKTADFSPAVVHGEKNAGLPRGPHPPGSISFHHAQSLRPSWAARNVFVIMGKDFVGNYWMTGTAQPAVWARLQGSLSGV